MIHLPRVLAAAGEIQTFCQKQGWRFCFIGGVAVQRWGEPRLTQDVDLTLLAGFGSEAQFIDRLLGSFAARRSDTRDFALRHRVLLLPTGTGVDYLLRMKATSATTEPGRFPWSVLTIYTGHRRC